MLAVYCPDERQTVRIRRALAAESHLGTDNWSQFVQSLREASCGVVVLDWLAHGGTTRIGMLRQHFPDRPLVLVTRKDADNALLLKDIVVQEVIWSEDLEHGLSLATKRAQARAGLQCFARELEKASHLPSRLRHALAFTLTSANPPLTLAALATAMGCDRRTLWRCWKSAVPEEAGLRLQDFLDWVVLLRAVRRRSSVASWSTVASQIGVHEQTLSRNARRLLGLSLRDIVGQGEGWLDAQFERLVVSPLTQSQVLRASA